MEIFRSGHSIVGFGVVFLAGINTLYMLCFLKKLRKIRSISQHFALDIGKKDVQSNNFLKLNGSVQKNELNFTEISRIILLIIGLTHAALL